MRALAATRSTAGDADTGLTAGEKRAAIAEVVALFVTFIVAFTGRSHFSDAVKDVLIVISVLIGAFGALAGLWTIRRGFMHSAGRVARFLLGGFMAFIGIYTIFHVLS